MTSPESTRRALAKTVGAVVLAGCLGLAAVLVLAPTDEAPDGLAYANELMKQSGPASRVVTYDDVVDVLPNVRLPDDRQVSDLLLIGEVVDVVPGRAFFVENQDAEAGTPIAFDDHRAQWRTVHLIVESDDGQRRAVGLSVAAHADPKAFMTSLASLGRVALPVYSGSNVFRHDPAVKAIVEDGQLLMQVSDDGALSLPFLDDQERAKELLRSVDTLSELESAAAEPTRQVDRTPKPLRG